jgi:two-component system sensor histidine kinase BarA
VPEAVNWAKALARCNGEVSLLTEILDLYAREEPRLLSQLEAALAKPDAPAVQFAAHSLKGMAGNLDAGLVQKAAFELERMARAGELAEAPGVLTTLKQELARLDQAIGAWRGSHGLAP